MWYKVISKNWPLVLPILVLIFTRIIGFEGVYGQDAYEYERYTQALTNFILTGQHPGDYFWPLLYPLFGSILNLILPTTWALQLISLVAMLITLLTVKRIVTLVYNESQSSLNWFVFIGLAASPYFLRTSVLCMSDMLATCFCVLALYRSILFGKDQKPIHWVYLMLFATAAFMTRYAAFPLVASIVVYTVYLAIKGRIFSLKHLLLAVVVSLIPAIPHMVLRFNNLLEFSDHNLVSTWSILHYFQRTFISDTGSFQYLVPNGAYMLSPFGHAGYLLIGAPLILYATITRHWSFFKSPFLWISIPYLLFLGGINFQNQRFFTLVFPIAALAFCPVFRSALQHLKFSQWLIALTFVMQMAVFIYSFSKFYNRVSLEKQVAVELNKLPVAPIYTMDLDISFNHYHVPHQVNNLYYQKYDEFKIGGYALVNKSLFEEQWKSLNPGINWERLKDQDLKHLRSFRNGWELYVIN